MEASPKCPRCPPRQTSYAPALARRARKCKVFEKIQIIRKGIGKYSPPRIGGQYRCGSIPQVSSTSPAPNNPTDGTGPPSPKMQNIRKNTNNSKRYRKVLTPSNRRAVLMWKQYESHLVAVSLASTNMHMRSWHAFLRHFTGCAILTVVI